MDVGRLRSHSAVLRKEEDILKRWKGYFEKLLNEGNDRLIREDGQVNMGMVMRFSREEVIKALRKTRHITQGVHTSAAAIEVQRQIQR